MERVSINTPEGTRDHLFAESRRRREVEATITGVFRQGGYSEIMTPQVEYYDLFVRSGNPLPQESMVKIIDPSGKILVMRPDNTTPIARVAASRLHGGEDVQRLYYCQSVFRTGDERHGREFEIPQCGVELIGQGGIQADVEVILLAIRALEAAGAGSYHIELGHAGYFKALTGDLQASDAEVETIRGYVENKQFAALSDVLERYSGRPSAQALGRLGHLFGGKEVLDEAQRLYDTPQAREALEYLRSLQEEIGRRGYGHCVRFDLGLVNQIDYYTGVVFRGYMHGAAAHVLSGGRYDNLLSCFGTPGPATGFGILTQAVEENLEISEKVKSGRLRIAVTKGRLLDKSVELFEKMGMDCSQVKNPGRKLVLPIENYPMDVVMSKAPDVLTYVEQGVCDLGIVGKDTILESESTFYEVLDLKFGKCRFALAVKEGEDFYGTYKARRVASKYPKIAKEYFARKGMDVDVIKIEGSVELAPLLGLADGIVDIVETGSTLKANGLVPIETVCQVSARLIVNTASMKLYRDEILDFIAKCEAEV